MEIGARFDLPMNSFSVEQEHLPHSLVNLFCVCAFLEVLTVNQCRFLQGWICYSQNLRKWFNWSFQSNQLIIQFLLSVLSL